jgi:predicted DNA-binding transcriptional regulator AlpA
MRQSAMPAARFRPARGAQAALGRSATPLAEVCDRGRKKPRAMSARRGSQHDKLTVDDVCAELGIAKSSFYEWRQKGRVPRCIRLPNGALRVRRTDFENWLAGCEDRR